MSREGAPYTGWGPRGQGRGARRPSGREKAGAGGGELVEMVDENVRVQIAGRCVSIAETHQHQWHAGVSRGHGVGDGIADHHGLGRVACRAVDGGEEVPGVGLLRRGRVSPDDSRETPRQAQGVQQGHAEIGAFVCADGQPGAPRLQGVHGGDDPRERPALIGDVGEIIDDEILEQAIQPRRLKGLAGRGETARQQGLGASANERSALLKGEGRDAFAREQVVQRAEEIGRGLHQGAVEIENDGGARQGADGMRHGCLAAVDVKSCSICPGARERGKVGRR